MQALDSQLFGPQVVGFPVDRHPELPNDFLAGNGWFSNGVWRWGPGMPHPGAITAHAREVAPLAQHPTQVEGLIAQNAMASQLSKLVGITSIATIASVLTLGVSVVRLGLVSARLGALRRSVSALHDRLDRGVAGIHKAIQGLENRIVMSAAEVRGDIQGLKEDVARLQYDMQAREFSTIKGMTEILQRQHGRTVRDVREDLRHVERSAVDIIPWFEEHVHHGAGAANNLGGVDEVVFSQAYAATAVMECAALFHLRGPAEAASILRRRLDAVEVSWAMASARALPLLMIRDQQKTVLRDWLGTTRFDSVTRLQSDVLPPRGGRPIELENTESEARVLLGASFAACAAQMQGMVEELEDGDPAITDPMARWESSEPQHECAMLVRYAA